MNTISAHLKSTDWDFRTFKKKYSSRGTIPVNLVSYAGMNLPPLISRVPASVRESKMSTDEENPGAQYNEAGLEKNRVFLKKNQPSGFVWFFWVFCSVPDPWHFGVDPDPDPSVFIIDLQDTNKKQIFFNSFSA